MGSSGGRSTNWDTGSSRANWCATARSTMLSASKPPPVQRRAAASGGLSHYSGARCLGVTPKVICDLTKEGVIERGSGRLFQLEDSVRRYCEHLRRQTGGSS